MKHLNSWIVKDPPENTRYEIIMLRLINTTTRRKIGYIEGSVSIAVNIVLFVIKYIYGTLYNSIAVVADALHTLSDSLTSAIVILGFWISYRPADEEHPFGHGRAETVATIVIGVMLVMVGIEFLQKSIDKILSREGFLFNWVLVLVLAISTLIKEVLARWSESLGSRYNSTTLVADAWHHRSDAIATAILAIAITFGKDFWWLDGALGLAVSALLIYVSTKLVLENSSELLGKGVTKHEEEIIKNIVYRLSNEIKDVHHIHIHRYGNHVEVTLHIKLDPETSLKKAHEIASEIEKAIKNELGWEATVHVEPIST
ncbi:MAG: cation diffusion facilitator family transporter [Ignisphaera sp.]